jgi:hypothetical protein
MPTPDGTNKKDMLLIRKCELSCSFSGFMALTASAASRINIAITLAGKGTGSSMEIPSPKKQAASIIPICHKNFIGYPVSFRMFWFAEIYPAGSVVAHQL